MAEEEKTEETTAPPASAAAEPEKTSEKNPFVAFMLLLNAVALAAVAFFQYSYLQKEANRPSLRQLMKEEMEGQPSAEAAEELAETQKPKGIDLALDGFTVNLAKGDGPRRFVRINTVLRFSDNSKEAEFTARKPQIRDTIISILNSKRPEDLLKREGKEFLKEEIKSGINSFLIDGEVIDVFYVNFQIN
jgi:flagellar FliL protein